MSVLRSLYQGTRAVHSAVKDVNRLREIGTVMARYGFGALFEKVNLGLRPGQTPVIKSGSFEQRVVDVLQELGPTFVKFGQIMSTRPDLIPQDLCTRLQQLQDHVSEVPFARVTEQIERELGAPPDQLFARFDNAPLASASIAQVHTATTHAGDDVVVKVRRPGITRVIEADLSIMHILARRIEEIAPEARLMNLSGMLQQFERSLARETDFAIEAASIQRFGRNFQDMPSVFIPQVFADLSTPAVLTMQRVRGCKLTELDPERHDTDAIARLYLSAAYKMIFADGFFHGDLHPGNVFVDDDGRIALIDFGMVGRLSGSSRDRVVDVLFALMREDLPEVARTFYDLGIPQGPIDYSAFETEVIDVMERHFVGRTLGEIAVGAFFADLVDGALKFNIRMPADYTMLFKALLTTEGLAREVAPDVNPIELARPFIENLIKQRYSVDRLKRNALVGAARASTFLSSAVSSMQRIFRDLESGDHAIRLALPDATDALDRLRRARDRQTLVMMAAVLCALGLFVDQGLPRLAMGLSLPGLIFVGLALLCLGLVMVSMWRRDVRRKDPGELR